MADLNEIKDINADLPLTNFPDEIDDLESFSDADDEINSAIITYKNLMKQGETAKAEELYEKYSLKKYIVSAYFLNKIQHMIIACERSISSVKKYFSFSTDAPTGTTSQPNGYLWGKVLQAGDYFKKVILKLKENGNYVDIFPRTTADNVLMSEDKTETVKDKLEELSENLNDANEASNKKMNKDEPRGTGSIAMNTSQNVGKYASFFGSNNGGNGENAFASGKGLIANIDCQSVGGRYNEEGNYAQIIGNGLSEDNRKNIYTVDWDGNVKAKSFNASGDIIYNDGKSLTQQLTDNTTNMQEVQTSLSTLSNIVSNNSSNILSISNSSNFGIVDIKFYTNTTDEAIDIGSSTAFIQEVPYVSGCEWLFIPRGMSKWTGGLDVCELTPINDITASISFTVENISSEKHTLKIGWYWILYKPITYFHDNPLL